MTININNILEDRIEHFVFVFLLTNHLELSFYMQIIFEKYEEIERGNYFWTAGGVMKGAGRHSSIEWTRTGTLLYGNTESS